MLTGEQRMDFPELRLLSRGKWSSLGGWRGSCILPRHTSEKVMLDLGCLLFFICMSRRGNDIFLVLKGIDIYFLFSRWQREIH